MPSNSVGPHKNLTGILGTESAGGSEHVAPSDEGVLVKPEAKWTGPWSIFCASPGASDCGQMKGGQDSSSFAGVAINVPSGNDYRGSWNKYHGRTVGVEVYEGAGRTPKRGVFTVEDEGPNAAGRILDINGPAVRELGLHDSTGSKAVVYLCPKGLETNFEDQFMKGNPIASGSAGLGPSGGPGGILDFLRSLFSREGIIKVGKVLFGALLIAIAVIIMARDLAAPIEKTIPKGPR